MVTAKSKSGSATKAPESVLTSKSKSPYAPKLVHKLPGDQAKPPG